MKNKTILLILFIVTKITLAQTVPPAYYAFVKKADSLYKAQKYKSAALSYSSAFETLGWKGQTIDRYNAACAWAMSGYNDSAFDCLNRIIKKRLFTDFERVKAEKDFTPLRTDKRWQTLLDEMKLYSQYKVPEGWFIAGTPDDKEKYIIGVEKGSGPDGKNAATIKVIEKNIAVDGSGNLMQNFPPDAYINKRVRMSAYMKSNNVDWASFWLRVDQNGSNKPLAFDNMIDGKEKRPVKGTTEWKKYEIVLDVPEKASNIAFGVMLGTTGQIWFDNFKFEIVDKSVPATGKDTKTEPTNLNFEE